MKNLIKLEELAQFAVCVFVLAQFNVPWWCYLLVLVGPDISMAGYLVNTSIGTKAYNLFHHKGFALLVMSVGYMVHVDNVMSTVLTDEVVGINPYLITGLILYGHASLDRIFGYGLKFGDSFQHTHLGWIGKHKP